jgi:dolichol-phosphate mannosyltransferase
MLGSLTPSPTGPLVVSDLHTPVTPVPAVRLSLIVPTYNEAANLPHLLERLRALLGAAIPRMSGGRYEIIVVDDDSPDRGWAIAADIAAEHPEVRVIRRTGERGLSTAVIRGWQAARGEVLGVIDADLQHPPELITDLLSAIDRGADLAVASRNASGGGVSDWSRIRQLLSRGAQLIALAVLPSVVRRLSDPMSGYFLIRRSALAGVELSPLGYKILLEVAARGRVGSIAEVGYVFRAREHGESKVSAKLYLHYLRHLLRLRIAGLRPIRRSKS